MNGEIFVESVPGEGSIFTARLPQGRAGAGKLGRELAENLRQCKANMLHMNMPSIVREPMPYGSVLIVDDLETNLYVGRGLMMPYGLSVDTALSGFAAIDKIRNGKEYDIVFMDHMMPEMDGMEATKILRGLLGYARPIVALTANAVAGQATIFLENGFDDFLSKPIDLRQLNVLLNRLIRDKQPLEVIEAARRRKESAPHAGDSTPQASVDPQLASIFIHDAEKALMTLEAIHTNQYRRDDDFRMFVITVHAMKSALANIGEVEMAAAADSLEQAGRERDTAVMAAETPPFLDALRAVIEKIASKEEDGDSETADEDLAYLSEKLHAVQAACAAYNIHVAEDALTELRQKAWSRQTRKQLDAIATHLLLSEFEDAAACCGAALSGYPQEKGT
jgi:CheY-like chemotaxis protein